MNNTVCRDYLLCSRDKEPHTHTAPHTLCHVSAWSVHAHNTKCVCPSETEHCLRRLALLHINYCAEVIKTQQAPSFESAHKTITRASVASFIFWEILDSPALCCRSEDFVCMVHFLGCQKSERSRKWRQQMDGGKSSIPPIWHNQVWNSLFLS